jgi:hypothetical protein
VEATQSTASTLGRICNYALAIEGFHVLRVADDLSLVLVSRAHSQLVHRASPECRRYLQRAVLGGDTNKLPRLFADDILIVHSDGTTDSKANFLGAISSRRLKMRYY